MRFQRLAPIGGGVICVALGCRKPEVQHPSDRDARRARPPGDTVPTDSAACGWAVTSIEIRTCETAELHGANRRLSALEDSLRTTLDSVSVNLLTRSSRQWNAYRRGECEDLKSVYAGGTMGPIAELVCFVDLTNARVEFLHSAYSAQLDYEERT